MKLKQKFIIAFLVIALLVGVVCAAGFFAVQRLNHIVRSGEEHFAPIIVAATEISSYAKRAEGHIMLFLALGDEADAQKFHQRIDSLYEQIAHIESLARNPEARSILNTISARANDLFLAGDALLAAHAKEKAATGDFKIEEQADGIRKLNKIAAEIRELGIKLAELEASLHARVTQEAVGVADAVSHFILIIGVFAIFIALLIGYLMGQSIVTPVLRMKDVTNDIDRGNFSGRVAGVTAHDEISELARAFNQMADDLSKVREDVIAAKENTDNVIRFMPDALLVLSADGHIEIANPAICKLLGYRADELIGQHFSGFFVDKDEVVKDITDHSFLIKKGIINNVTRTYLAKDGDKIPVFVSYSAIVDNNWDIQKIICVSQDVTKIKLERKV